MSLTKIIALALLGGSIAFSSNSAIAQGRVRQRNDRIYVNNQVRYWGKNIAEFKIDGNTVYLFESQDGKILFGRFYGRNDGGKTLVPVRGKSVVVNSDYHIVEDSGKEWIIYQSGRTQPVTTTSSVTRDGNIVFNRVMPENSSSIQLPQNIETIVQRESVNGQQQITVKHETEDPMKAAMRELEAKLKKDGLLEFYTRKDDWGLGEFIGLARQFPDKLEYQELLFECYNTMKQDGKLQREKDVMPLLEQRAKRLRAYVDAVEQAKEFEKQEKFSDAVKSYSHAANLIIDKREAYAGLYRARTAFAKQENSRKQEEKQAEETKKQTDLEIKVNALITNAYEFRNKGDYINAVARLRNGLRQYPDNDAIQQTLKTISEEKARAPGSIYIEDRINETSERYYRLFEIQINDKWKSYKLKYKEPMTIPNLAPGMYKCKIFSLYRRFGEMNQIGHEYSILITGGESKNMTLVFKRTYGDKIDFEVE